MFELDTKNHDISEKRNPMIFSVASGKGGVGKTLTTIHLALSWQNLGYKVLVIDGDLGLANIDVILGLHADLTVHDVVEKGLELGEIALNGPLGLKILPSGSGVAELTELAPLKRLLLSTKLKTYVGEFDIVLIDNGAGINLNVREFTSIANQHIVVTTPEPHALTDAYALIKVLSTEKGVRDFQLLINMSRTDSEASSAYQRISKVASEYLGVNTAYLGSIPLDQQVTSFVRSARLSNDTFTHTIAGQKWSKLSQKLVRYKSPRPSLHQSESSYIHYEPRQVSGKIL